MWEKEQGWVLSVDPATLKCGASLWHNGMLIAWVKIDGGKKSWSMSRRLRRQAAQIDLFLEEFVPEGEFVTTIVFEQTRNMVLDNSMGIWYVSHKVDARQKKTHYFNASTWKKWAQGQGAKPPSQTIKGLKALREIGWDFTGHPVDSDDVADSIMIYKSWAARG